MNSKKFFESARNLNIKEADLNTLKSTATSISLFNGKIDSYNISNSIAIEARGVINNKFGVATTNVDDTNTIDFLLNSIQKTGTLIEKEEDAIIFKGSKKYVKKNVYNKELNTIPLETKIDNLYKIDKFCREFDSRIENISVAYNEDETLTELSNSYGLSLKSKKNSYMYYVSVTVRDNGQVVNADNIFFDTDFNKFDYLSFSKQCVEEALSKVNPIQCKSKKYKALLSQKVVATLLKAFVSSLSSEEVQKHTSALANKLNEQIASPKITILEKPLEKNLFFTGFDDEGVATYNKEIVKKGILKTYLYNLTTAKKDNVESTGNGYGSSSKIGISTVNLTLKPGKKSFDELLTKLNNGVYITEIMGLHAGLNFNSGDFSLQAQGYLIEDGKITKPLSLIVVAGNLFDVFMNIKEVGSDVKLFTSSTSAPSVILKSLAVSGN